MRNLSIIFILTGLILSACKDTKKQETPYLDRAEEVYHLVWEKYRVNEYGLFSEFYPNSYKPDLTYMQGDPSQAKEVSYLWPMSGVFSATTVLMELDKEKYSTFLDSMIMAEQQYYDTLRTPAGYQAYPSRFEKVDRYYDDNGLVGIDYIDSYQLTQNKTYLDKAKEVMTFIESGWSEDFGGGVSWLEGVRDQKPACSNGKATVLALKLYQATKEQQYLDYGLKSYNWVMNTLRDDSLNIIWNSLLTTVNLPSGEVQKHAYTYNTGTMIQSAVRLYNITQDEKYLNQAKALAEGSHSYYFGKTEDGIPYVKDMPWFTIVLLRGYQELYEIDQNPKYVNAIIELGDWAWENARDSNGLFFNDWTGRVDQSKQPKWILDESCMAELYARIAQIKKESR
ncbi:glycoside hydrolase family 88 protein [Dysgonomonas sp. Marseille-P4677]|uniref:glycoside hydrolase family 76 protein n=1 Tax=Dysgonomonas sp. Marseille-P4677 TaxID=2364790 RepID=UPI0019122642|nr:glycoside hydrolase family 76 protein [Dysgonomonas sp. Marseille-P4677]MBK5720807.1 glycoside hydrolase family 88 protein [Dysgonomonas sp. Marseille-P4677]